MINTLPNRLAQSFFFHSCCPVCASENIQPKLTAKDYTVSHEEFEIWECGDCSLRFTQGIPVEEEIGKYYQSEEYISHSNTNKGIISTAYQIVRQYTLKMKKNLVEKDSGLSEGSILDIGCGTGEFLSVMQSAGWSVKGLEPDEGARTQAEELLGNQVFKPSQLFQESPASYDVISMWHVLEHVHQLHEYIKKIHEILKPNGTLFIAVPNYLSKDAASYQKDWAAYDVPRHLYHFTPQALSQLVSQYGFRIEEKKAMPFDAFYVSLLSEKYIHGKNRLISASTNGLNSWLTANRDSNRGSAVLYKIRKYEK
ncbi:MAG: class I SAM-dependent methyltransferase [Bacteroidota bacterium]